MTPQHARLAASKYERDNPTKSLHAAFMAGYIYATTPANVPSTTVPEVSTTVPSATVPSDSSLVVHSDSSPCPPTFTEAWNLYDRKDAKQNAIKAWNRLTDNDRVRALQHIPFFVQAHPDKQFRPMLATYLNQKRFLDDEIISNTPNNYAKPTTQQQELAFLAQHAELVGELFQQ